MRHGLTELNKKGAPNGQIDEPLAPEGLEQVKAAISLIPKSVKHIYTSSLLRARQTAEIIGSKLNLPIIPHDGLMEIHMGSLAGQTWESMKSGLELKKKHRAVQFDYHPYGGESVDEVKRRVLAFLASIKNKHNHHEALLVTHGGIIRLLRLLDRGEAVYETEKQVSLLTFDLNRILEGKNVGNEPI